MSQWQSSQSTLARVQAAHVLAYASAANEVGDDDDLGFDDTRYLTPKPPSRLKLLLLLSLSSTLIFLFVLLPTVLPDTNTYFHYPRYGLNDFLRTIDPFINFPLIYLIFICAKPEPSILLSTLFTLSAVVYLTGSVSHTTSAMFEHSIEVIQTSIAASPLAAEGLSTPFEATDAAHHYIRDIWEHIIGYYLYAAGIFCMSALTIAVHFRAGYPPLPIFPSWMLLYSSAMYGVLYALLASQIPYAPIIGSLVFAVVFIGLGFQLWKDGDLGFHHWASRPIPQLYFMSTGLACVLTIVWTGWKGIH